MCNRLARRAAAIALALCALTSSPAASDDPVPQIARGVVVPPGFLVEVFAQTPGMLPTSLHWAGTTLYVTAVTGNAVGGSDNGVVLAYSQQGRAPTIAASSLDQPLGVAVGADGTLFVSETEVNRGRVTALRDADGNGSFETRRTVIRNLPNGRHQTNGLTFGPDGWLYVANGSATDDGLECGPALTPGGTEDDCPAPEVPPYSGSIMRVNPAWDDVDLLTDVRIDGDTTPAADGMDDDTVLVTVALRNVYDVDFDPLRPNLLWAPMNGPDNPSGSEPLYAFDVAAGTVADAGFPSCLYDPHVNAFPMPQILGGHEHAGAPEPRDNPNPKVIRRFGRCDVDAVVRPKALFTEGHEGTSGVTFVRGSGFPADYRNDLMVAEWGSLWNLNSGKVTGHKVIHVDLNHSGAVVGQTEFMTGALPIDVAFGPDGRMYVADMAGQIYAVDYLLTPAP
jgi:glucose/arabinose dehydrogenase